MRLEFGSCWADDVNVSRPFVSLTGSKSGSCILAAFGAAAGAALALTVSYSLGRFWIVPWLDSLPDRDTDMFGRPEGWLVVTAMVLFGPLIVIISAWLAMRSARRAWDLDGIPPGRLLFVLLALVLGAISLSSIDALGTAAGLTVVVLSVGVAGFVSCMASPHRASVP